MIEKSKISSENPEAKQKVYERLYNQTKEKETNEKKKAEERFISDYGFSYCSINYEVKTQIIVLNLI